MVVFIKDYDYNDKGSIVINLDGFDEIYTSQYKYNSDYQYYIVIRYEKKANTDEKKLYFGNIEKRDEIFSQILDKVGSNVLSIK